MTYSSAAFTSLAAKDGASPAVTEPAGDVPSSPAGLPTALDRGNTSAADPLPARVMTGTFLPVERPSSAAKLPAAGV